MRLRLRFPARESFLFHNWAKPNTISSTDLCPQNHTFNACGRAELTFKTGLLADLNGAVQSVLKLHAAAIPGQSTSQ
jgi:hypothetical protein